MKTAETRSSKESTHTAASILNNSKKKNFFLGNSDSYSSFFGPSTIQPKLKIGQPGDRYEQEADRVADTVVNTQEPVAQRQPVEEEEEMLQTQPMEEEEELQMKKADALIMRKCEECEKEEHLQQKAKTGTSSKDSNSAVFSSQLRSSSGSGRSLPNSTRSEMEAKIGASFGAVNIHTDSKAIQMNQQLSARAFTYGNDIYFNRGEYNPGSTEGKYLLAHELTHVLQQGNGLQTKRIQRLGTNPNCTNAEADTIHQAIYNARGWVNNALSHLRESPTPDSVLRALRRNFGSTYGVAANLQMIINRIRLVYRQMATIPYSCAGGANPDALCDLASAPCGWANAGSDAVTICRSSTLASADWIYQAGCVLHEAFHATFSRFTVDEYSGWHGHSGSSPTYPGTGTDPLLNADSYTSLVIDLSGK